MKKRTFILLLLSLSMMQGTNIQAHSYDATENKIISQPNEKLQVSKKDAKKELKRRKRFHKSLLSAYNEGFENIYLKLIENNAEKILSLKETLATNT